MIVYCPRCGSEPRRGIPGYVPRSDLCQECGLALSDVPSMLRPSDSEVQYGLDEWPPADRAAITAGLIEREIPYRWDDDFTLAVPETAEQIVDLLLDDVERGEEVVAPQARTDGGPDAQAAMADLFVIADRLHHVPFDAGLALEFETAAKRVAVSLPPYGIDDALWRQIQELAADTVTETRMLYNDDAVAERSGALRDLLREFV